MNKLEFDKIDNNYKNQHFLQDINLLYEEMIHLCKENNK